jgi:hypothetical protein
LFGGLHEESSAALIRSSQALDCRIIDVALVDFPVSLLVWLLF